MWFILNGISENLDIEKWKRRYYKIEGDYSIIKEELNKRIDCTILFHQVII